MTDGGLSSEQDEVSRLMGRCVLRLQQYEGLLKSVLASHDIAGPVAKWEGLVAARAAQTSGQTLGGLITQFLGVVLIDGESVAAEDERGERAGDPPSARVTLRLALSGEDFARTEAELRDLVQLRNDLIHHFMARYDLWSPEGCRIARQALAASCDRIGDHVARLRAWVQDLKRAWEAVVEEVRSEAFRDMVVNAIQPDGSVVWPAAGIVAALREAACELAVDGWTEVSAATRWIAEHYPHQTPEKYGCRTMREVIHLSGEFNLCRLDQDGIRKRHYRLR